MANVTMGGFRPWGTYSGGAGVFPSPMVQEVANNYNTALGVGDIIIAVTDGTIARGAAANNGLLLGVAIGFSTVVAGKRTPSNYVAANTTFTPTTVGSANATLCEFLPLTPDLILEVDADDGVATDIATQVGFIQKNADMTTGNADASTGMSTYCLDISTDGTATANFRIVGIAGYTLEGLTLGANDPTASRFKFLVVCNEGVLPMYTATGV